MQVWKGHGTENDFVLVPDLDGGLHLTPALVRALCDRRAGIGADGVLRIIRSENDADAKEMAAIAPFFMDYRNADGSIAEMCGNGVRVFMRYLMATRLVGPDAAVATRGGIMRVRSDTGGDISVQMGSPQVLADRPVVTAAPDLSGQRAVAAVLMPNPHVIVAVAEPALVSLDLTHAPAVEPALPTGQNVEFVARVGPRHLRMRVHERGVGETRSCGTGICAAVVAVATDAGDGADGSVWRVDVPGGTCHVVWSADGVELTGPAVLVARIEVDDDWLAAVATAEDGPGAAARA